MTRLCIGTRVVCLSALLTACLAVPTTVAAQAGSAAVTSSSLNAVEPQRWTVTAFLGGGFGGDLNNSPLNLGVASAYNFGPRFSVEGEFGYGRGAQQGALFNLDTSVWNLNANAVYHFGSLTGNWLPYGTIGLGMLHGSTDLTNLASVGLTSDQLVALGLNNDGTDTELALNFGGGVKRRLANVVNFRADLRYFSGRQLAPSFWRGYAGLSFLLGSR